MVLLGATVLTALAAFARSYREAQGYLPLLMFLPMVPSVVLMVAPVKTQLWMLAVPFLAQNQLIVRILRGESIVGAGMVRQPGGRVRAGGAGVVRRGAALSPRAAGHFVLIQQRDQLDGPGQHGALGRMEAVAGEFARRCRVGEAVAAGCRP